MARLLIKTDGIENRLIELKLGVNRIGRSPDTDFAITHPTVSSLHCEVVLMEEGVTIRDLESTNGTFVDGRPVREARLSAWATSNCPSKAPSSEWRFPNLLTWNYRLPPSLWRMDPLSARVIRTRVSPIGAPIATKSCASRVFIESTAKEAGPFCSFAPSAVMRRSQSVAFKNRGRSHSSRAWVKRSR